MAGQKMRRLHRCLLLLRGPYPRLLVPKAVIQEVDRQLLCEMKVGQAPAPMAEKGCEESSCPQQIAFVPWEGLGVRCRSVRPGLCRRLPRLVRRLGIRRFLEIAVVTGHARDGETRPLPTGGRVCVVYGLPHQVLQRQKVGDLSLSAVVA